MLQEIIIQAEASDAGCRLDAFVAARMPSHSRAQVHKFIKSSELTINGRAVKPSLKITGNESVILCIAAQKSLGIKAQNLALDILFHDDHIAVISKPVGMVVHPGAGVRDNTLVNALLYYFPNLAISNQERPGIVHRLDKNTSGVMLVALSHEAHVGLSQAFKQREISKSYRAFCFGEPDFQHLDLKTGHVRHPHHRLRFFTGLCVPKVPGNVRFAHTSLRVGLRAFGVAELYATLHTGRTHQIRAHMADINHPLLGDHLYGGGKRELIKTAPLKLLELIKDLKGQALHAECISFAHPISKQLLTFSAPLPANLAAIRNILAG